MKQFFTLLSVLLCTLLLYAEPYFVRINGTIDHPTIYNGEAFGKKEYLARCVPIRKGDVITCYDVGGDTQWAISNLDAYSAPSFTATAEGLVANQDGTYDFYAKLQYQNDQWYVATSQGCEQYYRVTLMRDGVEYAYLPVVDPKQGVVLPTLESCNDHAFVGWTETDFASSTTEPTLIASGIYKPQAATTLYAVYRTKETWDGKTSGKYFVAAHVNDILHYAKADTNNLKVYGTTKQEEATQYTFIISKILPTHCYIQYAPNTYITHTDEDKYELKWDTDPYPWKISKGQDKNTWCLISGNHENRAFIYSKEKAEYGAFATSMLDFGERKLYFEPEIFAYRYTTYPICREDIEIIEWQKDSIVMNIHIEVRNAQMTIEKIVAKDNDTSFEPMETHDLSRYRNEDGTFTIPINRLDTLACSFIRLQLTQDNEIVASIEQIVPIIITTDATTADKTYFTDKLTHDVCRTCDVVVRDQAALSHAADGRSAFRYMTVYAGSRLEIPANTSISLKGIEMHAQNDIVSYAILNNDAEPTAAIYVEQMVHIKHIDGQYWYPFSLPYDCRIVDIRQHTGETLGTYGVDWGIKYYDGQRRQAEGNSTTAAGEVSQYWTFMPADATLEAHQGYIIGLFVSEEEEMNSKAVRFTPITKTAYTEETETKQTTIQAWGDNLTSAPRHHGWNFVGSPYISLFGPTKGEGLYHTSLAMGYTDAEGNQQDKNHVYLSIPDGGNSNTYTQVLASATTIKPFTAYFVQAVDPANGQDTPITLTYSKGNRTLPALSAHKGQYLARPIQVELLLSEEHTGAHDNTGIWVSDRYTTDYEIGEDLVKMYAAEDKPQLFTLDAQGERMAYHALPDYAAQHIPLALYLPADGTYTLSLQSDISHIEEAEAIYLVQDGKQITNLLYQDYSFEAEKGLYTYYSIDIRRIPQVQTGWDTTEQVEPIATYQDGTLTIEQLPEDALIIIYDIVGHMLLHTTNHRESTIAIPSPQVGVYTIMIQTRDKHYMLKTLVQ